MGLTMRTIEAIGMQKKLFTTNPDIVNYDFYDNRNIRIISGDDISIDNEFIDAPSQQINPEVLNRYSLEAWIGDVFNVTRDGDQNVEYTKKSLSDQ
jgi:hypothetical protein